MGKAGRLSFEETCLLLVSGTGRFRGTCLLNAVRRGRTHCWLNGTLLPALAVVGVLNVRTEASVEWSTYTSLLWVVVLLSFIVEWIAGPFPVRVRPREV